MSEQSPGNFRQYIANQHAISRFNGCLAATAKLTAAVLRREALLSCNCKLKSCSRELPATGSEALNALVHSCQQANKACIDAYQQGNIPALREASRAFEHQVRRVNEEVRRLYPV
jgi:hypothetical protein